MMIHDDYMEPCPKCGGMVVLVDVPRNGTAVWCTECNEVLKTVYGLRPWRVAEYWNEGVEPPRVVV